MELVPETNASEEENGEALGSLRAGLCHLPETMQADISETLHEEGFVAWTLDDLRPAEVPVSHRFELRDSTPIHHSARRIAPRHQQIV